MVESNLKHLTPQEAEWYDRKFVFGNLNIGSERLQAACILLCGRNGLEAEVARNIILAGLKSITLLDCRTVFEVDVCAT